MMFHPDLQTIVKTAATLQECIPINITDDTSISSIQEEIDFYSDDLQLLEIQVAISSQRSYPIRVATSYKSAVHKRFQTSLRF